MAHENILIKIQATLDKVLLIITGTALVFATSLTFIGVILRYIFGISFEWNEEICRYSMILIVYFAAGIMIRGKEHIYFSLIYDRFGYKAQQIIWFFVAILILILGFPIIVWGWQLTNNARIFELKTLSLLFPLWPAYALIPVGMMLIVFYALLEALRIGLFLHSGLKEALSKREQKVC